MVENVDVVEKRKKYFLRKYCIFVHRKIQLNKLILFISTYHRKNNKYVKSRNALQRTLKLIRLNLLLTSKGNSFKHKKEHSKVKEQCKTF